MFPYAELDDTFGMVAERDDQNQHRAQKGKDQEGWEELMGVVKGNRERMEEEGRSRG